MEKIYPEINNRLLKIPLEYFCSSYEQFSKDVSFLLEKELIELRKHNVNIYMDYNFIAAYNYRNGLYRYRHAYEEMIKEINIKEPLVDIDQKFVYLEEKEKQIVNFLNNMKEHSSFSDITSRIESDVYTELKKINPKKNILNEESFSIKKTIESQVKKAQQYHLNNISRSMIDEVVSIFSFAKDRLRNENDAKQMEGQERAPRLVRTLDVFKNIDIREEMDLPERLDPNIFKV
jgi:hypothetical protein